MRVAVVRQGEFDIDPRVQREVHALLQAGHEVDVIALRGSGTARVERDGALTIRRLPLPRRRGGATTWSRCTRCRTRSCSRPSCPS